MVIVGRCRTASCAVGPMPICSGVPRTAVTHGGVQRRWTTTVYGGIAARSVRSRRPGTGPRCSVCRYQESKSVYGGVCSSVYHFCTVQGAEPWCTTGNSHLVNNARSVQRRRLRLTHGLTYSRRLYHGVRRVAQCTEGVRRVYQRVYGRCTEGVRQVCQRVYSRCTVIYKVP